MITTEFLDISGAQIPVDKFYEFTGTTFVFRLKFNKRGNFFTFEIYDSLNLTFLFSNKIVYGSNLIDSLLAPFQDEIIALNTDILRGLLSTEEITAVTLGDKIKLYTSITEDAIA